MSRRDFLRRSAEFAGGAVALLTVGCEDYKDPIEPMSNGVEAVFAAPQREPDGIANYLSGKIVFINNSIHPEHENTVGPWRKLWLYGADNGSLTKLSDEVFKGSGVGWKAHMRLSPNGEYVAFGSGTNADRHDVIQIVNLEGGVNPIKFTVS